jgi:hypothetical protein
VVVVLVVTVIAAAALAQLGPGEPANQPKEGARSPLKFTVKTDKGAYHVGDTIHFTLELRNPTKAPVPVTFATGQKYDVFLLRPPAEKKPAEIVWQWSLGMMFTQMVSTTTFAPGKTVEYEVKFPPDDGTKPPALTKGSYTVKAEITTMGSGPKPEAVVKFKVK